MKAECHFGDDPWRSIDTPCFVVDRHILRRNLAVLNEVKTRTGCRILLALKAFAMFRVFDQLQDTLDGTCASSPFEARLGREEFGGEVHVFAPAYSERDMQSLLERADHISFNSFVQWQKYRSMVSAAPRSVECALRINPEYSEAPAALYDPCAPGSRLGIRASAFAGQSLDGLHGLHFHSLCQQNADALARTLQAVERRFAPYLPDRQWVNFGGGHHITREDYDVNLLCRLINAFMERYGVMVYLEPGEAVAMNAGVLVATVLDIVHNEMDIAILDTSAAAHMPDVLEMPYRPEVVGADRPGVLPFTCRLAGVSCLAGDEIGDYSFAQPLRPGDRVLLRDMAHYTMVKTNTFNGIPLPAIMLYDAGTETMETVKTFDYEDFRNRLS